MKYLQSVLENQNVRDSIENSNDLLDYALEALIPLQTQYNLELVSEHLDEFVAEGDEFHDVFDSIAEFSKEDTVDLMTGLNLVISDNELNLEEKRFIIDELIEESKPPKAAPKPNTSNFSSSRRAQVKLLRDMGYSKEARRRKISYSDNITKAHPNKGKIKATLKSLGANSKHKAKQKGPGLGKRILTSAKQKVGAFKEARADRKSGKSKDTLTTTYRRKLNDKKRKDDRYHDVKFNNLPNDKKKGIVKTAADTLFSRL